MKNKRISERTLNYKGRTYVYFFSREEERYKTYFFIKVLGGFKYFEREYLICKKKENKYLNILLNNGKKSLEKVVINEIEKHRFKSRKRKLLNISRHMR